jgi:hypothetical protein
MGDALGGIEDSRGPDRPAGDGNRFVSRAPRDEGPGGLRRQVEEEYQTEGRRDAQKVYATFGA